MVERRQSRWSPADYAENAAFVPALGAAVLQLLDPQPGELILDVGCGDGALTARIAEAGARVIGLDCSAEMVEAARARGIDAFVADAEALDLDQQVERFGQFDAVFSNAALHWMLDPDAVAAGIFAALQAGRPLRRRDGRRGQSRDPARRRCATELTERGYRDAGQDPLHGIRASRSSPGSMRAAGFTGIQARADRAADAASRRRRRLGEDLPRRPDRRGDGAGMGARRGRRVDRGAPRPGRCASPTGAGLRIMSGFAFRCGSRARDWDWSRFEPPSQSQGDLNALSAFIRRRPAARCWPRSARRRSTICSSTCPRPRGSAARSQGLPIMPASWRSSGSWPALARPQPGGGRGALLPRLRRLSPSYPGERRSSDPARRVPDQLHALPARNRPGHAAGAVRVPDPGRAPLRLRRRQRLDVRRLDRLLGGDRDGAADHAARQGDPLERPASRIMSRSRRTMARFTGDQLETALPELVAQPDTARLLDAIDGETSGVVVQYPDILGRIADLSGLAARAHAAGRPADRGGHRAGGAGRDPLAGRDGRRHRRRRRPVDRRRPAISAGPMSACSPARRSSSGRCRAASPARPSTPRASAASC